MKTSLKIFHNYLLLIFALPYIGGCTPPKNADDRLELALRYSADTDDAYGFEMLNSGDSEKSFRGWKRNEGQVTPVFSAACAGPSQNSNNEGIFAGPKSLPIEEQQSVKIPPSSSLSLLVPKSEFVGHAGKKCFITVLVAGDHALNSDEFIP